MNDQLTQLEATLHHEIPLSRALGLRVAGIEQGELLLAAPITPNTNHKDTAFAGSLNAVVTLAGWSALWLLLRQEQLAGQVVIQDSSVEYLHPVTADFVARCGLPGAAERARLLATLRRRRRARIELAATIAEQGRIAVRFSGRYVVLGEPEPSV
jgi:thioesterase domain-containing protein